MLELVVMVNYYKKHVGFGFPCYYSWHAVKITLT